MADTIRQLLADVIHASLFGDEMPEHGRACPCFEQADALLASPELAAIIDLAAYASEMGWGHHSVQPNPEVRAYLQAWREERSK